MARSSRLPTCLVLVCVLALSLGATSCGGGSGGSPDLVLVGFNLPNISGVPLNQPLIFTFSAAVDISTVTPDTVRVIGAVGPNFELETADGNVLALLPRSPNFDDYSDAGLAPGITYSVSLAQFPAPATITSTDGKPLLDAESFTFTTVPSPMFIEPRRPINRGLPPSAGGRSDDEGCLQNPDNELYAAQMQFGSGPGARLLCLKNEGPPRILLSQCEPLHNNPSPVGFPSAVAPSLIDLPAIRLRFNEPLDPLTVTPFIPTQGFGVNVQVWRVGDTDRVPIPPERVVTTVPTVSQSLSSTEIVMVSPTPVDQGTYLVNITPSVTDLPGNPLLTGPGINPDPADGGFVDIENNVNASGSVPQGMRLYWTTEELPGTPQAINESFSTSLNEWGDIASGATEPGVFTRTNVGLNDLFEPIPGTAVPAPNRTNTFPPDDIGQSTTANWHGGFRMWNRLGLLANPDADTGEGRLKAVWKPYMGDGGDGSFESSGLGVEVTLTTDGTGDGDGDGIYEFRSFLLRAGDSIVVNGPNPLVILCRGDFVVEPGAMIDVSGVAGGPGFDTDGSSLYSDPRTTDLGGDGGAGGPGGGAGGAGGDPLDGPLFGEAGGTLTSIFGPGPSSGGLGGAGGDGTQQGGGGGGFGNGGDGGITADNFIVGNGGPVQGTSDFERPIVLFTPDRGYMPNSNGSGGTGGGGGGVNDTAPVGTAGNGDDGGGGGGGAGGGLYVICGGTLEIGGSLLADGGAGGSTYGTSEHQIDFGDDGMPGGSGGDADFVSGLAPGATANGTGAPGGGGSGGGIVLIATHELDLQATAILSATGGAGGQSGTTAEGGGGAGGRVFVGTHPSATVLTNAATIDVSGGGGGNDGTSSTGTWRPTVDLASVGQSEWFDLFVDTADFGTTNDPLDHPDPGPPFFTDNFQLLVDAGLVRGAAGDFEAILEFQGADSINPVPSDPSPTPKGLTSASGVTPWATDPDMIDGKRYIRYRWRFFVADDFPGVPGMAPVQPMPAILEFTIPFVR